MNDPVLPGNVAIKMNSIADAISFAEGYGVPNAIPTLYNNPGDLIGSDGKKIQFTTYAEGRRALLNQIHLMVTGLSHFYKPWMTWEEIGKTYDGETAYMNWVNNVTGKLGVAPDSKLQAYLSS